SVSVLGAPCAQPAGPPTPGAEPSATRGRSTATRARAAGRRLPAEEPDRKVQNRATQARSVLLQVPGSSGFVRLDLAQPLAVELPGLLQERQHGRLAVVGVRPGPRDKGSRLIAECDLGINTGPQVDTMGLVLGGRQREFAQRQQSRIQVEGPRLRVDAGTG